MVYVGCKRWSGEEPPRITDHLIGLGVCETVHRRGLSRQALFSTLTNTTHGIYHRLFIQPRSEKDLILFVIL